MNRLRRFLVHHGWAHCDSCHHLSPPFTARRTWLLGGFAGFYDLCPTCLADRAAAMRRIHEGETA